MMTFDFLLIFLVSRLRKPWLLWKNCSLFLNSCTYGQLYLEISKQQYCSFFSAVYKLLLAAPMRRNPQADAPETTQKRDLTLSSALSAKSVLPGKGTIWDQGALFYSTERDFKNSLEGKSLSPSLEMQTVSKKKKNPQSILFPKNKN